MLGLGKTSTARARATASPADSGLIYQRHAAALYRQALLTRDEDGAHHRLAKSVVQRLYQLASGPLQSARRPLQSARRPVRSDRRRGERPPGGVDDGAAPSGLPGKRKRGSLGLGAALGLWAVRSLPDARRYVAMRKM